MKKLFILLLLFSFIGNAHATLPVHEWWDLSGEEQFSYFDYGAECYNAGKQLSEIGFYIDREVTLDDTCKLKRVELLTPANALIKAGYGAQRKGQEPGQKDAALLDCWGFYRNNISFQISFSADSLDAIEDIQFRLTSDIGTIIPRRGTLPRVIKKGGGGASDLMTVQIDFYLYREDDVPYLTPITKRVNLSMTKQGKRVPVTFWIDGSDRIDLASKEKGAD